MAYSRRITALILFLVLVLTGAALAQRTADQMFDSLLEEWQLSLVAADESLNESQLTREELRLLKRRLENLRGEVFAAEEEIDSKILPLQAQIESLGPEPGEDEPDEQPEIAGQRASFTSQLIAYQTRLKQAELVLNRIDETLKRLRAREVSELLGRLTSKYPIPILPSTIATAVPEFGRIMAGMAASPVTWWHALPEAERSADIFARGGLFILVAIALGVLIRKGLLRWCGRDYSIQGPSYLRRVYGGVAEGLANGIIPALIFAVFVYAIEHEGTAISGYFASVTDAFCRAMIFLIMTWALCDATLSPTHPDWRLVNLKAENAKVIARWIVFLAAIFSIDLFFQFLGPQTGSSDALKSLYVFVSNGLEMIGILALMRRDLWDLEDDRSAVTAASDRETETTRRAHGLTFWNSLRIVIVAITMVAFLATLVGYAIFGAYLTKNLLASGVIVGFLFLLRRLGRDIIGGVLRSRFARVHMELKHRPRELLKFWLRAVVDISVWPIGVFMILALWGVPIDDLWLWTAEALHGITIGNFTFSIVDLVYGLLVFLVLLIIVRLLKRVLQDRVLPQMGIDTSLQHSLAAGFGYLGIIFAAVLGVVTLGLDLTNLALIFGALSVGIGFGLREVVSNLVSGVILLFERPIKVGDWIIVSGVQEGFVKRIGLRSTEIETFQRASVIIPNTEIITNSVVNWTHQDHYGRLDIPVRVAFGTDIDQVDEILMTILRNEEEIVSWPAPQVLMRRYGESALEFEARGFLRQIDTIFQVQSRMLKEIDRAFREAGIEVPYPQRDLHMKDWGESPDPMAIEPNKDSVAPSSSGDFKKTDPPAGG